MRRVAPEESPEASAVGELVVEPLVDSSALALALEAVVTGTGINGMDVEMIVV